MTTQSISRNQARPHRAVLVFLLTNLWMSALTLASQPDTRIPGRTHVVLTFYDSYGFLSPELWPGVQDELSRLFSFSDGSVILRSGRLRGEATASDDARHGMRVNAILMPMEPSAWNLDPSALAAVVREPGKQGAIYLFAPSLARVLGRSLDDTKLTLHRSLVERALGRVLAHELVHFLLPGTGHSESGLMASRLDRRFLTRADLPVDPESMFRLSLAMWERAREALVVALARELRQPAVDAASGAESGIRY